TSASTLRSARRIPSCSQATAFPGPSTTVRTSRSIAAASGVRTYTTSSYRPSAARASTSRRCERACPLPSGEADVASTPTRATALAKATDDRPRQKALARQRERQPRGASGMKRECLPQPAARRSEVELSVEVVRSRDACACPTLASVPPQFLREPLARQ